MSEKTINYTVPVVTNVPKKPVKQEFTFNDRDNEIIDAVMEYKYNVFLHGPAGTGKTTLIQEIIRRFTKEYSDIMLDNEILAVTATTGAACINLKGGTTVHRFGGILRGDGDHAELYKRVRYSPKATNRWRSVRLLIIDEISMMGSSLFDKLDYVARKIRGKEEPFGGIQLLICGDLLQLPPINDRWVFQADVFDKLKFKIYNLTLSRRYTNNEYFYFLLRIRDGKRLPSDMKFLTDRCKLYNDLTYSIKDIKPTILYSKKMDVNFYNLAELENLPFKEHVFIAVDSIDFKHASDDTESARAHYKTLLEEAIPEKLQLKVGAQVMLRFNLDFKAGLINGSRGVVVDITPENGIVKVKFMNGVISDIGAVGWEISNKEVISLRGQIPLILAWACTVHKSQGATLDCVVCDLGDSIFANAQAYVALSRVRNVESLYLSEFREKSIRADPTALKFIEDIKKKNTVELVFED